MSWRLGIDWRQKSGQYVQRNTGRSFSREYFLNRTTLAIIKDWIHDNLKDKDIITVLSTGEFNDNIGSLQK